MAAGGRPRIVARWLLAALALGPSFVQGKAFLSDTARLDALTLQQELSEAMGLALGCGGRVSEADLQAIERELAPIWHALPKVSPGRVERRSLRYLVHRHFDRRSALHIRGFEPSQPVKDSGWSSADILSRRVPAYVESVLESKHRSVAGFDLRDAAYTVATIQQLLYDSESAILEKVYTQQGKLLSRLLSLKGLQQVLESYLLHWFVGNDEESMAILVSEPHMRETAIPHWKAILAMVEGRARALQHMRQQDPLGARAAGFARPLQNALSAMYSFEDAHLVVAGLTTSFASFWESECQSIKTGLVDMDSHHTGRVPLSKFYSSSLDGEWRYGESEQYLRELGALDETSWRGKQVIISNYVQGASNCIVSTPHYLVCCANECEALMGELETAIDSEAATPSQLLALVGNISSQTSLDDDLPAALATSLVEQLEKIGSTHGGLVPLHGRLFAQWLHYAFPHECPFPHKAGTVTTLSPGEFGDNSLADSSDMKREARDANASDIPAGLAREELQWMSQWSAEEELISEKAISSQMRPPWEGAGGGAAAVVGVVLLLLGTLLRKAARSGIAGNKSGSFGASFATAHEKSHFV